MVIARGMRVGEWGVFSGTELHFCKMEGVLEMVVCGGCTTMPLNHMLNGQDGEIYVIYFTTVRNDN